MRNRNFLISITAILVLFAMSDCGTKMTEQEILEAATNFNSREEYSKAVEMHQKLMETYPDSEYYPKSLFMIGFIYANSLKKLDDAEKIFKEFLQKYPDNELTPSVKWELEHLGQTDIGELIPQADNDQDASASVNQ